MSEDKEIKFPSGSTIRFAGEDLKDVFKGLSDNHKLKASIEKYRNTDCGEKFESFDLFEKTEVQKLRSSKERKLWKLKRLNVKLGQKRKGLFKFMRFITTCENGVSFEKDCKVLKGDSLETLITLSEQIGKNSNKIQRLRTLIQQEKTL